MINIHFLSENKRVSAKIILDAIGLSSNSEKPNGDKVELILLKELINIDKGSPILLIENTGEVKKDIQLLSNEILSYGKLEVSHLKRVSENLWSLDIDVLSITEYIVFRYEEMVKVAFDEHQRFKADSSLLFNIGFLQKPIINYIIEFIKSVIDKILRESGLIMPYIERWQVGSKFVVSITIDLDHIRKHPLPLSLINPLSSFKRFDVKNARKNIEVAGRAISGSNRVLIDIEKLLNYSGEKITLFACGKRRHPFDPEVSAQNYRASYIVKSLSKIGAEISLHGSYASMFNGTNLMDERKLLEETLGKSVEGVRMHYVRLRVPDTLREIERVGFIYDSSLTYSSMPGFRAGIGMPFRTLPDGQLYELPPSLMDSTLFFRQKLNFDEALRNSLAILGEIERTGGYSAFIFHNQHLIYDEYGMIAKLLLILRDEIKKRKGDILTCIDTLRWWKAREESSFRICRERDIYRIEYDIPTIVLRYGGIGFLGSIDGKFIKNKVKEMEISHSIECKILKNEKGVFKIIKSKR